MKKRFLLLSVLLMTISQFFGQQKEYVLSKPYSVGCPGANPLTDITKKISVNYKSDVAIVTIKNLMCSNDLEIPNYSEILEKKDYFFYEKYSGIGMIQTEKNDMILFLNKGDKYDVLTYGNEDKKLAKSLSNADALNIVSTTMKQLESGFEEFEKKQKEKEEATKQKENEAQMKENAAKQAASMGDFYNKNKGKILFTEKKMNQDHSRDDKESDFITEFELGSSVYARAFLDEPSMNRRMNVKFSIGDVSVSSEQLRDEYGRDKGSRYSGGVASSNYYASEFIGHFPMISAPGGYYGALHSMTEDAFRVLLNRVAPSLTKGSTHVVKVELTYANDIFDYKGETVLSGEVKMKVTEKSENLLGLLCRCSAPAKKDAAVEKEVKDLFLTDPKISKVHSVSILKNDYKIIREFGNPVKRTLEVQVIFTNSDGWDVVWKGLVSFNYEGTDYSKKANWHKNTLYIPVAATCIRGIK